ncbi:hypothetical protein HT031_006233 [Scenedesmus sp. PABB004]|nr:hypothetical protein HT031_006233 [Scenedesmus sp. PABB004]
MKPRPPGAACAHPDAAGGTGAAGRRTLLKCQACVAFGMLLSLTSAALLRGWDRQQQQQQQQRQLAVACPQAPRAAAQRAANASLAAASSQPRPQVVPELPATGELVFPGVAAAVLAAEREGRGRSVISMALYGAQARFTDGALDNALLVRRDWGNWTLRVYVGDGVPEGTLTALQALGAELVRVTSNQRGAAGMFWRFYVLEDRTVSRFIIRDADSRLTRRDRAAVDEWVASGAFFHTLHDNPYHSTPVMGGMWGAVNGLVSPRIIAEWRDADAKNSPTYTLGNDQAWLAGSLWPHVKNFTLQHASFQCGAYGAREFRGFPTKRESMQDFVGNIYVRENEFLGMNLTQSECPAQCRRHASWTAC